MEPSASEQVLTYERLTARGRIRLVVRIGGTIQFVETLNVSQASSRKRVASAITEKCPGIPSDLALSELDKIAAEIADTKFTPPNLALAGAYRCEPTGLWWDKPADGGSTPIQLTNFSARIGAMVVRDDGATPQRHFEIEATVGKRTSSFVVPASSFVNMNWVLEHLGSYALVYPGYEIRDHTRAAIQILSGEPPTETVYLHTGWRQIEPHGWCFLHAGGAIGTEGPVSGIEVDLCNELKTLALPDPRDGADLVADVRESLALLKLAPATVSYICLSAAYRVVIAEMPLGIHIAGKTGAFKTEFAALIQAHFGEGVSATRLPGSWSSTSNFLEAMAFQAKDMLVVIDDFAPSGAGPDIQRQHRDAERLFRALGNRRGRSRLASDTRMRPTYFPRGTVLSTGEDCPSGHSINARLVLAELSPEQIDPARLSICQAAAARGHYARAMSAFLHWLAARLDEVRRRLGSRAIELRDANNDGGLHRRLPSNVAELLAGFEEWMRFAVHVGAIDDLRARRLTRAAQLALQKAIVAQSEHLATLDPVDAFVRLLSSALVAGRAHIRSRDGSAPDESIRGSLGWAREDGGVLADWRPKGDLVGWIEDGDLYLEPTAAVHAAQRMAGDTDRLAIGVTTLGKRLAARGCLRAVDSGRDRIRTRHSIGGSVRSVWHTSASLLGIPAKPSNPAEASPLEPGAAADHDVGGAEPEHADPSASGDWPEWPVSPTTHRRAHDEQPRAEGGRLIPDATEEGLATRWDDGGDQ